jgi:PAS domain S-box-containing protein
MLECTEEVAQVGVWDWDLEADHVRWSDNLFRIFGLEPGGAPPAPEDVLERLHPEDRGTVEREIEAASQAGRLQPLESRIVRPDGETRYIRASAAAIVRNGGRPRRLVGSVQDITDRREAERQVATLLAISEALAAWETLEQGAPALLQNIATGLDCAAGILWLPQGDVLVPRGIWPADSPAIPGLGSTVDQVRLPRGVGLAGQVWESGESLAVSSLADDPRFAADAVAEVRGALALPVTHTQEVLAVLEFFYCDADSGDAERARPTLAGIGYELGLFLAHHRGELRPSTLTKREREVLQLAAQGRAGREIAEQLVVSPDTVRSHFENIYDKYGVSDRAAAVAKALRDGLID